MKKIVLIDGMSCDHCVKRVTNALSEISGTSDVQVKLSQNLAEFSTDGSVTDEIIKNEIEDLGFDVREIKTL